ncbi:hypothetical protein GCM10027408_05220 [Microbacterium tumbae]
MSPSTVSGQIAALEDDVGEALVIRARGPHASAALTPAGEELARLAHQIVAAHADAVDHFRARTDSGRVRLAVADDIAASPQLGDALRRFRLRNPRVVLEVTIGQSGSLRRRLRAGQFELALVKTMPGEGGDVLREERIVWVAHPEARIVPDPVPLVAYPRSSFLRNHSVAELDRAGRAWTIANTVRGVNGALTAMRAGIGIGVLGSRMVPDDLAEAPPSWDLPALGRVRTVLLHAPQAPEPALRLHAAMRVLGADLLPS